MILAVVMLSVTLFVPGAMAAGCASIFSGSDGPDILKGDRCDTDISGLRGGSGRDRIYSGDLDGNRDLVFCGDGRDFASIGENDSAASDCELVAVVIE